jgi:serine/threonine-protein kinase
MSSMIGKEIGIYRITERLGQGGMGVVFKAIDVNLERVVALKLLNSEVAEMPELVQRFHSEARVQAGLSHPNLTTLYAFLVWEGRPVMIMEFIEGETFQSMIARRGPIPANVTVPLFRQALLGVGAAHRRGIIHRDIKPANLMLNQEGIVKVMDFGIAKVMGVSGATRTNMQVGTSWYMSPEQIMTNAIDTRSDIYSLGVTLYEMLAGQLPFDGDSDYAVQMAHLEKTPDPPTVHYPHIPPHVVAATMRALAKKPEHRFQSVDEFLAALDGAMVPAPAIESPAPARITPQPVTPPPPPPPPPPPSPQQFTRPSAPPPTPPVLKAPISKWVWIGGGSAAALLLAGGLFYSSSLARQRELERERIVAQQQEAENKRQAALRKDREDKAREEEQRTAQELTERVKKEQEEAESQIQAQARARAQQTTAAQRAAAQRAAQQAAQQATQQAGGPPSQPPPSSPAANLTPYQRLNGTWAGSYICAQGPTAAQMLINATPQGVAAAFGFAVPNSKPGTFLMSGTFSPVNGQLNLRFVRWGNQPPNYLPANLTGTVDLNQNVITGRVLAPGCSTFVLRRK